MKKDLCKCGKLKDIRSKRCSFCYHTRPEKKYYCNCGQKLSDYRIKQCSFCDDKERNKRQIGKNNSNYKGGFPKCIDCKREVKSRYAERCWDCYVKWSRISTNNPNYKDGKCREPYPLGWTDTYKEQIRFRDKYKCQICGCHEVENGRRLDVHHVDYEKENLNKDNLISLCQRCHTKTNFDRVYWYNLLKNYMCGYLKDIEIKNNCMVDKYAINRLISL